ncbi:MAG: LysM peptidoglycan-binding domain-containing protein [Phycisphaerales bacterium]|nr:LysM peptidoglycan-binding domain-containing protein [Phycisphaerales bacterium]
MTLNSQIPRSSSLTNASSRRIIPIALVAALGIGAAVYIYTSGPDATPSAENVSSNAVPAITAAEPTQEMPEVKPVAPTKPVAIVVSPKPNASPAPAPAPVPAQIQPKTASVRPSAATLPAALLMVAGDPVGARLALTMLVDSGTLTPPDLVTAIESLREINARLVYSPTVAPGDQIMRGYTVASGDTLSTIARRNSVQTDWRFIQRINGLKSERSLRVGQQIKIPVGAFHAEVSKSTYLMKVYAGEGPSRVIVGTFTVGLGEFNSTPTGAFMVRPKSKLVNPEWRNPRTGEHFMPDDPKNPIGERWIGLMGVEAANQGFKGYGIHGTIEPDSIGKQASMGCLRLRDSDVATVYELLTEPNSTIVISP